MSSVTSRDDLRENRISVTDMFLPKDWKYKTMDSREVYHNDAVLLERIGSPSLCRSYIFLNLEHLC